MSDTEVVSLLLDDGVEREALIGAGLVGGFGFGADEVGALEGVPEADVGVDGERVEVAADGAAEEEWISAAMDGNRRQCREDKGGGVKGETTH